jgi:ParB/RepB/Spo0J family partition protein
LDEIIVGDTALRGVNRESVDFRQLVASVKKEGVITPITVREDVDPDTGEKQFVLIDGLQRYTAATEAGLETIKAVVSDADASRALSLQFQANIHRVETKPAEYSKQLHRIIKADPSLTIEALADKLSVSIQYLQNRLSLSNLIPEAAQQVDAGEIKLTNAFALSKLPAEEQANFIEPAKTDPSNEFVPTVHKRVKEIQNEKRKGRKNEGEEFSPTVYMRKMAEIRDEMESNETGKRVAAKLKGPDAWNLAMQWILHQDPESVAEQKAKWEDRQQKKKEAAEARKKAREEAKKAAEV